MIKELPQWVKVLGIISILFLLVDLIIAIVVWMPCFLDTCDGFGEMLITVFLLLPFLGMIVGFWIIGFILKYLISKRQKFVSNVIAIVGLLAVLVGYIFFVREFGFLSQPLFSGLVIGLFFLIGVLYFIIALILINKK